MLKVTEKAEEKIRNKFKNYSPESDLNIRMVSDPINPDKFDFALDRRSERDTLVKGNSGDVVFLLSPHLSRKLDRKVLDYREKSGVGTFIILDQHPER